MTNENRCELAAVTSSRTALACASAFIVDWERQFGEKTPGSSAADFWGGFFIGATMAIKVEGIFVAPAGSLPMEARESAELIVGKGIAGDRYASQTGNHPRHRQPRGDREHPVPVPSPLPTLLSPVPLNPAASTGSYSVLRASALHPGEREPGRQLTLLSADSAEAALARAGLTPVDGFKVQGSGVRVKG